MPFSHKHRSENLKIIDGQSFDLVIVGGGITGAGVARDAVSRGLKVCLLEAKDFASGTSSRSSKLIHGGIRYLENFEFGLVYEALAERSLLFEIAPHLVHPLRFIIPIYKQSRVGFWKMAVGMWAYDILSLFESPQMHEALSISEAVKRLPDLNSEGLTGAFEYSDAYMDDDRLVIETLRSAHKKGAVICNHTSVTDVHKDGDKILSLVYKDSMTGESGKVFAKQMVTTVGPWTDIFGRKVVNGWKDCMRPTKGVHITFRKDRLPVEKAIVMAVEKRIIFVIPREEMVIVGTTDTDFKQDPSEVRAEPEDIEYLLQAANKYFPDRQLTENDIVASYAGVRPLVNDGSQSEGKTSREHSIFSGGPNLTFVSGGKYTTYRKMAEDTVDFILKKIGFEERSSYSPSNTKIPLNEQVTISELERLKVNASSLAEEYGISRKATDMLIWRHGNEFFDLVKYMKNYLDHDEKIRLWMAEAEYAINETCCLNLEDFYWRRSPLFLADKNHGLDYLDNIAQVFAEKLSLSPSQVSEQKSQLKIAMEKELGWKTKNPSS